MTVKLIINSAGAPEQAALAYGARLARRLHTDLFVFSAMPRPEGVVVYTGLEAPAVFAGGAVDAARKLQDEQRSRINEMFAAFCDAEGLGAESVQLEHIIALPGLTSARQAVLAEPLIFPRTAHRSGSELNTAFERVLMEASLPVVLAPDGEVDLSTAVIAWDGSAEASRAIRLHETLIRAHDNVIIAQNPDDISSFSSGEHTNPRQLQAWLSARQLPSEVRSFGGKVADGLYDIAASTGAGLIVSGAYGHSRTGEFLFGGATRGLLKADGGPALALAH